MANLKAPLRISNPTSSFVISKDRESLSLSSHFTHKFDRSKQMGIETRLFYEYKNCERLNGQTFFFTLTYNNKNLPIVKFGDQKFPSFDYFDLVQLLNGAFKKQLLRKYGTNLKYFVSCELGDGAGSRGFGNNPHYHCLFFLRPDSSKNARPYKKIDPVEFRSLLRLYWQGFDEDLDKQKGVFHSYRNAKKGIVKEGKFGIAVTSFRACIYVAKYVCKPQVYINRERRIYSILLKDFRQHIRPTDINMIHRFLDAHYPDWKQGENSFLNHNLLLDLQMIIDNLGCRSQYLQWIDDTIESMVKLNLNEYRNRYGLKYRISHGVGEYALDCLDLSNDRPVVPVETSHGIINRPLNLYYYRKLYTEVLKDNYGNPVRVINQAGIDYKSKLIESQVHRLAVETKAKVDSLSRSLFDRMLNSSVYDPSDYSINMSFDDFSACYREVVDKDDLFERYAKFKLVYSGRFCPFVFNEHSLITEFPVVNLVEDYRRFLRQSVLDSVYNPMSASYEHPDDIKDYISYNGHPYFRNYMCFFSVFDLFTDYLFVSTDTKKEVDWQRIQKAKEFHSKFNLIPMFNKL